MATNFIYITLLLYVMITHNAFANYTVGEVRNAVFEGEGSSYKIKVHQAEQKSDSEFHFEKLSGFIKIDSGNLLFEAELGIFENKTKVLTIEKQVSFSLKEYNIKALSCIINFMTKEIYSHSIQLDSGNLNMSADSGKIHGNIIKLENVIAHFNY